MDYTNNWRELKGPFDIELKPTDISISAQRYNPTKNILYWPNAPEECMALTSRKVGDSHQKCTNSVKMGFNDGEEDVFVCTVHGKIAISNRKLKIYEKPLPVRAEASTSSAPLSRRSARIKASPYAVAKPTRQQRRKKEDEIDPLSRMFMAASITPIPRPEQQQISMESLRQILDENMDSMFDDAEPYDEED
jgi:hypothetical protein